MISHSEKETIELGIKLAKKLKGGEIIGLVGDLGGGKTTFVKGLSKGLGIKEQITSPTFVVLKEYPVFKKTLRLFVHIDAYRLENAHDIKSIGIKDYLARKDVLILIEWAEKIKKILPKSTIYIKFDFLCKNSRKITFLT